MAVTGIRALLEAAEFLNKEEIAKSRELYANTGLKNVNEMMGCVSAQKSEGDATQNSQDSASVHSEKTAPGQDREAHNKLEKDRRADLKARFEKLQSLVPATRGKKCSNLSILRNASRYIHSQTRLEREYVTRIQHLSHEKSLLDKNLERAWQRLSVLGVDLARVRRKVRSKLAQREKREESSILDNDNVDEPGHNEGSKSESNLCSLRGSFKTGSFECSDETENHSRSISPSGSLLMPGSAEISSISEDDEGSESTTTASECGSNGLECGEITDEASECGEVVVQEGIVPSQSHTCVTLCPTPMSPSVQDASAPNPAPAVPVSFPLRYAACSMSGSFTSTVSALSGASEPQSGTSSDSGFSSGVNDDANGEVKLPMKKRKLARSLVQDLTSSLLQDSAVVPKESGELQQPPEKKLALSASNVKPRHETTENFTSLITTLPSVSVPPSSVAVSSSGSSIITSITTSSSSSGVTMSPSTSLTNSMPLLQRTLTGPRTPPASLVRHLSFESPENLNPNWMNQRIVPVYQLLSGTNTASPPANPSPLPASPPAAYQPGPEKLSLVTHSPVTSILKTAAVPAPQPPQLAPLPPPAAPNGATHLVLPVIGPNDGLILRNLATAGRQPIVLMPITAGPTPATSLVPIQLLSDGVVSSATLVNGKLDHT